MSRRSARLENAGYYDVYSSPRISYSTTTRCDSFPQGRVRLAQIHVSEPALRTTCGPRGRDCIISSRIWGNFALASHGAQILTALSSRSHQQKGSPSRLTPYSLGEMIKGHHYPLVPGHCWAFSGQTGELFVALAQKIHVSHITVGHISKEQSVKLGTFQYESGRDSFQTFEIKEHNSKIFKFVKLEVLTNHGHEDHTCLYSFRVYGEIPEAATTL
uniref:SUN domain-containing protein n=1 Tax=Knipowitschia caucasica TaxID=637954 RepID=A0AAV2LYZ7_KNICA